MRKQAILSVVAGAQLIFPIGVHAAQVATRTQLTAILGGSSTVDTFENANLAPNSQIHHGGTLNHTSVLSNGATNIVSADASYSTPSTFALQNHLGSPSTNLGSGNWSDMTIELSGTSLAAGLDVGSYNGYGPSTGLVLFYRQTTLLGSIAYNLSGATPMFAGWHDGSGIDKIVVDISGASYTTIDNVEYRVAVPEPGVLGTVLMGTAWLLRRRRMAR